jgi:hypothetical protein
MSAKLKTYIVPVVHLVAFSGEVEIEARSKTEARKLARNPDLAFIGEEYDWDRSTTVSAQLAAGCKATELTEEKS